MNVQWHPPLAYRYSYRTHDGHAMLLADPGYPRRWMVGPRLNVAGRPAMSGT